MDLGSLLLAPVRVPMRVAQALDDLATLADRARRDPDPAEVALERIDLLLLELAAVVAIIRELIDGGLELTDTAKLIDAHLRELLPVAGALVPTARMLDGTGRAIIDGGEELTQTAKILDVDTRELIAGGTRLTDVAERMEADLRVFRAAMPQLLKGLDTVEELEGAVETVAETIEPLQGAAEKVGKVSHFLSRD